MIKYNIKIYNTYFTLQSYVGENALSNVKEKLTTYTWVYNRVYRRKVKNKDKEFFSYDGRQKLLRFPKGVLRDTLITLGNYGITKDNINITDYSKDIRGLPLGLEFTPDMTLYDYQAKYVEAILENAKTSFSSLVELHTGGGKTAISVYTLCKMNMRVAVLVSPRFLDKWIEDFKKLTDIEDEDICVIKGGGHIRRLMYNPDPEYKVYIFSTRTCQLFFKEYETPGEYNYPIYPDKLMNHLGVGVLLNDEAHLEFHAVMKTLTYFNVAHLIGLSATMTSKDPKMLYMHRLVYPDSSRIANIVKMEEYITLYPIAYNIGSMQHIKWSQSQGYNHVLFEQSIMKNSVLLRDYINMIIHYVNEGYIGRRAEGDRMLIYCASIAFATVLANKLAEVYPELDVRRYTQDDPYVNIMDADISVTSLGKASTGYDIQNLITVLMTNSVDSPATNRQAFGRLRNLKGKEMRFYYTYCKQIGKQVQYHRSRLELLKPYCKDVNQLYYDTPLKTK